MTTKHYELLEQFALEGKPIVCDRHGCGHINETYKVLTDAPHRYISAL